MKYELAYESVVNFLGSDVSRGFDLDDAETEELAKRLAMRVKTDVVMSPDAVLPHAGALFPKYQRAPYGRVVPPRQPNPESLDETIRSVMRESDDYWCLEDATAFLAPIRERILASRETVYYNPSGLKKFLDEACLPIKAAIENALKSGWSASLFQRSDAYNGFVLKTFRAEGHPDPESGEAWRGVINSLGKEQGWALNQNGLQNRYDAAAAKAKASILKNGKWPLWSPQHGQIRWHDASELDAMGPDELTATITAARDLYKKLGESREDQQERLQDFADASAGLRKYRAGDRTELDGQVQFKEGPGAKYEFVGEHSQAKPSAGPMDRSTPVAESVKQLFIDPTTNNYYTKSSLHRLARVNPNLFRAMMRNDVNFMNSLLQQAE